MEEHVGVTHVKSMPRGQANRSDRRMGFRVARYWVEAADASVLTRSHPIDRATEDATQTAEPARMRDRRAFSPSRNQLM